MLSILFSIAVVFMMFYYAPRALFVPPPFPAGFLFIRDSVPRVFLRTKRYCSQFRQRRSASQVWERFLERTVRTALDDPSMREALKASLVAAIDPKDLTASPFCLSVSVANGLGFKPSPIERFALEVFDGVSSLAMIFTSVTTKSAMLAALNLYATRIPHIGENLRNFVVSKIPDFLIRGVAENDHYVNSFTSLGAMLCVIPVLARVFSGELSLAQLERFYTRSHKLFKGRAELLIGIQETLTWAADWGAYLLFGYDLPFGSRQDLKDWLSKCFSLLRANGDLDKAAMENDPDDCTGYFMKLLRTIDIRLDEAEVFLLQTKGKDLQVVFRDLLAKLQHLSNRVRARLAAAVTRNPPFTVLIQGDPGKGKGWTAQATFRQWAAITGKVFDENCIHTREDGDDYWSGYRSFQWGLNEDDICASNPLLNPDTRVQELIHVINDVPYITNQAEAEDKGKIPLLAEILVASANKIDFRHYYTETSALDRRLPLKLWQFVRPGFTDSFGNIDTHLTSGNEHDAFFYKIQIYDLGTGAYRYVQPPRGGEEWSLSEMQFFVAQKMRDHIAARAFKLKNSNMEFCACGVLSRFCEAGCGDEKPDPSTAMICYALPVDEEKSERALYQVGRVVKEHAKVIGGVATAITAVAGLVALSRRVASSPETITPVSTWDAQKDVPVTQIQKSTSHTAWLQVLAQNTWVLTVSVPGERPARCQCLHLKDGVFLTVGHIFGEFEPATQISVKRIAFPGLPETLAQSNGPLPLGGCSWRCIGSTDAVLLLPPNMPRAKGLIHHFLEHSSFAGGSVLHRFTSNTNPAHEVSSFTQVTKQQVSWPVGKRNDMFVIPGESFPSQCGSPLAGNHGGASFITGILCATCEASKESYVIPLTQHLLFQEMYLLPGTKPHVEEVLRGTYGIVKAPFIDSVVVHQNTSVVDYEGSTVGNSTPRTKCCPTHLFEQVEALKFNPGEFEAPQFATKKSTFGLYLNDSSPVPVNVAKMLTPKPVFDVQELSVIVDHVVESLSPHFTGSFSPLSLEEAINGESSLECLSVITSAGFPRAGNKLQFLDSVTLPCGRPWYSLRPELQAEFDKVSATVRAGNSFKPVFKGTLKDEVVTCEKNKIGKVRMFLASPMVFTILVRQYYLSFIRAYKKCALKKGSEHAYSVNHCSPQWKQLASSLQETAGSEGAYGAGDFSNFDKGMGGQVIEAAFLVIHRLMGGENQALRAIMADIAYPFLSVRGDLMSMGGTNPSGHPLTTVINCIVNTIYHRYAYLKENGSLDLYNEEVNLTTFGDDSIFASKVTSRFNQQVMQKHMKALGVNYTDNTKSVDNIPQSCPWEELTFLSRSFHKYGDLFVPLLNLRSIVRMISWHSPCKNAYGDLWQKQMAQGFWREYALYELAGQEALLAGLGEVVENEPTPHPDVLGDLLGDNVLPELTITGVSGEVENGSDEVHGTVHFEDNPESNENIVAAPSVRPAMHYNLSDEDSLGNFLGRPVRIFDQVWAHGATLNTTVGLWTDYLNNPAVINKVANFTLIRADMCVRIVTNGMPFHYGLGTVAITPLREAWSGARLFTTFQTGFPRLCSISQAPGPLAPIDPATNPIIELYQEFVCATEYANIAALQAGSDITPANDLHISCSTLRTSNGTVEDVNIAVWVWLENVELLVPTPVAGKVGKKGRPSSKSSKSKSGSVGTTIFSTIKDKIMDGESKDDGAITQFTSAFAGAADALTKLPYVGAYAQMASSGLHAANQVFSFFGLSRPTEVGMIESFVPRPFGDLASIYRSDTALQLSLDPRAGITPEPSLIGVDTQVDQMSIAFLAGKAGIFHSFMWLDTDVVNTTLQTWAVHPMHLHANAAGTAVAFAPVGYAAVPFRLWRGSIEYILTIVHSKFMSGRLFIAYNPSSASTPLAAGNTSWNTIVDLDTSAGRTEVILNVPYCSDRHYLQVQDNLLETTSTPLGFIYNSTFYNGTLTVRVVNQLRAPGGLADAEIFLAVRGGPDFEVAVPNGSLLRGHRITGVSGEVESLGYDYETGRVTGPVIYLGGGSPEMAPPAMAQVYIGEKVISYRALIKRYYRAITLKRTATANDQIFRVALWSVPPFFSTIEQTGYNAYGTAALGGVPTMTTPFQWCATAYSAYRGSVRFKVNVRCRSLAGSVVQATAIRGVDVYHNTGGPVNAVSLHNSVTSPNGASVIGMTARIAGSEGCLAQATNINPVLDFSVPYYSRFKFSPVNLFRGPLTYIFTDVDQSTPIVDIEKFDTGDEADIDIFNAAGDDFDCVIFLGSPYLVR